MSFGPHMRHGLFSLPKNSLSGHRRRTRAWRKPWPEKCFDVVVGAAVATLQPMTGQARFIW
jgi:hypothetical protein